jgi:hypothetical protein
MGKQGTDETAETGADETDVTDATDATDVTAEAGTDEAAAVAGTDETAEAGTEATEGASASAEAAPVKRGDVGKALHAERDRRRVAEEVSRRLQERLDALALPELGPPAKLEMGDEDILDGRQVRKLLEQQRGELRQDVAKMVQAQVRTTELMGYIGSFEVFDGESGLGNLGREVLAARLAGLKSIATPEGLLEARRVVEAVAKEVSGHQVTGENAVVRRGAVGARTLRPGPGAATATHIIPARKAPESLEEASAQAHQDVWGLAKRVRAKLGLK